MRGFLKVCHLMPAVTKPVPPKFVEPQTTVTQIPQINAAFIMPNQDEHRSLLARVHHGATVPRRCRGQFQVYRKVHLPSPDVRRRASIRVVYRR
jgi:hypothetical protein